MPISPIPPCVHAVPALYHLDGFWDPFSAASHLLGAVVFAALGIALVRRGAPDRVRQAFLGVYAGACVLLLFASGIYHATTGGGAASVVLVRIDHAAIFVLIAGTFTPIHALLFRGAMRWAPLTFIWAAALAGVISKAAYFHSMPEWAGLTLYLAMGWLGVVGGTALWRRHGFAFIRPLLLGGIAYSAGAVMEFCRWPMVVPGVIHAHDVFHIAVLVGVSFHFTFIWRFAPGENCTDQPGKNDASVLRGWLGVLSATRGRAPATRANQA